MIILGYIAAVFTGIALGLIGAGGSMITIPILVYLMGISPVNATSYSLFIVGITSAIGCTRYLRNSLISTRLLIVFGVPSVISIFLTRKYLLHAIPDQLFSIGSFNVTKNEALMILFALLMIIASYSMLQKNSMFKTGNHTQNNQYSYFLISQQGLLVGMLVGLVGAGGGFLIIPALVMLAKLSMKKAVGTSLAIISLNSSIGFLSDFGTHEFDWMFLLTFSGLAIIGIIIGAYISKYISGAKLKPAFGWFILIMGIYIITKELFFN